MQPWPAAVVFLWSYHEQAGSVLLWASMASQILWFFFCHVESSLVKLFFLKRPPKFFPRDSWNQLRTVWRRKKKLANHNKNKERWIEAFQRLIKLCEILEGFRLCHFIRLEKWARKHQSRDLRGFSFYAFSYNKQYWLFHGIVGNFGIEFGF